MKKAMIFDMDGVLLDSEPWYKNIMGLICDQLGFKVSHEEYQSYIGITDIDMWQQIIPRHGLDLTIQDIKDLQRKLTDEHYESHPIPAIEGIEELIERLNKLDWKMAIASSASRRWIEKVTAPFSWKDHVSHIVSGTEVLKGKPAPDIFLTAAQLLETDPLDCVVIEDADHGLAAAKAAGMKSIGFRSPDSHQHFEQADIIITDYSNLDIHTL